MQVTLASLSMAVKKRASTRPDDLIEGRCYHPTAHAATTPYSIILPNMGNFVTVSDVAEGTLYNIRKKSISHAR